MLVHVRATMSGADDGAGADASAGAGTGAGAGNPPSTPRRVRVHLISMHESAHTRDTLERVATTR